MKLAACIVACICSSGLCSLHAQSLEVSPNHVLPDESAVIHASGLRPNTVVAIQASLTDGAGQHWTSQAQFLADAQGNVDVSRQAPVKGSYNGVSPMGLVWSMKPDENRMDGYVSPPEFGVQIIKFQLIADGKQVSGVELQRLTLAEGVHPTKINGLLYGILFLPNVKGPYPAVLVVGGSKGGVPIQKAAWLASHGFAALALAYFRYEDLPSSMDAVPLEYFGSALNWMAQRPDILPGRIAMLGTSRGGELALQLGSMYPQIRAVVGYVPAGLRYPACCGSTRVPWAWTWRGTPLPFMPLQIRTDPQTRLAAAIKVEDTHGPILLISGKDDAIWPSSVMANDITERLKRAHFAYSVEHLEYSHAGHLAGRPEFAPAWYGNLRQPIVRQPSPHDHQIMSLGGSAQGDAQSSADAIPKVLEFLRTNLAPGAQ